MKKRVISLLPALAMIVSLFAVGLPMTGFADDDADGTEILISQPEDPDDPAPAALPPDVEAPLPEDEEEPAPEPEPDPAPEEDWIFDGECASIFDLIPEGAEFMDSVLTDYGCESAVLDADEVRAEMEEADEWYDGDWEDEADWEFDMASKLPTPQNVTWNTSAIGYLDFTLSQSVDLSKAYVSYTVYNNGSYAFSGRILFNTTVSANEEIGFSVTSSIEKSGSYSAAVQLVPTSGSSGQSDIGYTRKSLNLSLGSKLSAPSKPSWDGEFLTWKAVSGAVAYQIEWKTEKGIFKSEISDPNTTRAKTPPLDRSKWSGRVRALADLRYHAHSDYSAYSDTKGGGGTVSPHKNFTYTNSSIAGGSFSLPCTYEDDWFTRDSRSYYQDIGTMSMCMALAAYDSGGNNRAMNISKLFGDLGFGKKSLHYPTPSEDSIGYAIASKTIGSGSDAFTLIAVAVRGGGYEAEWSGNFGIGTGSVHSGFDIAANEVFGALSSYIKDKKISGRIKVWATGYSRAGATCNILGARLYAEADIRGAGGRPARAEYGGARALQHRLRGLRPAPAAAPEPHGRL